MSVFVIAEAGSCHDGDFAKAVALIDVAKKAGADACKFQYCSSAARLAARRRANDYLAVYEKYAVPVAWLADLKAECDARAIEFLCTVYLPEDIKVIAPFVQRFKIASFEAGDKAFVDAHRPYGKPIILSTGMDGPCWDGVDLLHCVSAYPAPLADANLAALHTRDDLDRAYYAGFSDHTKYVLTGAFAVCAGARILEVHFRDWDTDPANPDYGTALDPNELLKYVGYVRLAETMLGDGRKRLMPSEEAMAKYRVRA